MRPDASHSSSPDLSVVAVAGESAVAASGHQQIESAVRAAVAAERARIATELRDYLGTGLLDAAQEAASALSLPPSAVTFSSRRSLTGR